MKVSTKVLLVSGNYTHSSGQSIVNEQVISCISKLKGADSYVVRGKSRRLPHQVQLIFKAVVICLKHNVDTVYYAPSRSIRGILRDLFLYWVTRSHRKRLIVHWHGSDLQLYGSRSPIARAGKRALVNAVHICLCEEQERMVKDIWPNAEISVLPNALTTEFIENLEALKVDDNIPALPCENLVVSMVGAVRWAKGVDIFCSIAKQMASRGFEFHIYGPIVDDEGATSGQIQKLLEQHTSYLHYHGPVYGLSKAQAFLQTDILIFPSRQEAYPLVIIEALAAGCWVVSSNVGFISSIRDWRKLQVVRNDSTDAEAYERVISDIALNYVDKKNDIPGNIKKVKRQVDLFSETIQEIVASGKTIG